VTVWRDRALAAAVGHMAMVAFLSPLWGAVPSWASLIALLAVPMVPHDRAKIVLLATLPALALDEIGLGLWASRALEFSAWASYALLSVYLVRRKRPLLAGLGAKENAPVGTPR
jgi:hypothetical protein